MGDDYRLGVVDAENYGNTVVVVEDDERVSEWEDGLPDLDDLTSLSHPLIPHDLATAFSITPEPQRTMLDVTRASDDTIAALRANSVSSFRKINNRTNPSPVAAEEATATAVMIDDDMGTADSRKLRRLDATEEADSALRTDNSCDDVRSSKRPRLVWTPQLHKRFVEVVSHMGLNNAVPKTVMQMMNVDGLTRENVASHLQKYRLYLKRQSGEGPAFSDQFCPSEQEAYPHHLQQQQPPSVMPMVNPPAYHPFDAHQHYNIMQQQQQHQHQYPNWSAASYYASMASSAKD